MAAITTVMYSLRHLILSLFMAKQRCFIYIGEENERYEYDFFIFIHCLVNSESQSVSCVQCVNLIYQQKGFNRSVTILQIHRSI